MWKCDDKLLKAQKRTVDRRHHENAVGWNKFSSLTKSRNLVIVLKCDVIT